MIDNRRILYLLGLITIVTATVYGPEGYCLGHCLNCDPHSLGRCRGQKSCQWGFQDPDSNGNCRVSPSLQLGSQELGQRVNHGRVPFVSGWGIDARLSMCQYQSFGSKQIIDILGFFDSAASIEKNYTIPADSELFELSFSLVRTQWLPYNDFIIIQMLEEDGSSLEVFQISHDARVDMSSQPVNVSCQNTQVFLQKYRIKVAKKIKGRSVKVIFSSFLFEAKWGLTNIKAVTGCVGFSGYNSTLQTCSDCLPGTYLKETNLGFGSCISCPQLCKTCDSVSCTQCLWGILMHANYKSQKVQLPQPLTTCNSHNMILSQESRVTLPKVNNYQDHLYDQIIISITVFYDFDLPNDVNHHLSVLLNGEQIMLVDLKKDQSYVDKCQLFSSGRIGKVRVVSEPIHVTDNSVVVGVRAVGVKKFGVGETIVYSIKKGRSVPVDSTINQLVDKEAQGAKSKSTPPNSIPQTPMGQSETALKVASSANQNFSAAVLPTPSQIRFDSDDDAYSDDISHATTGQGLLQISINNVPIINGAYLVQISKVSPNDYSLVSNYYSQGHLILVINVTKSFMDAVVTVKEVSTSRRLMSGQTWVIAQVEVSRFDAYSQQTLDGIAGYGFLFSIIAWVAVISMFLAILSGYGIIVEQHIMALQMIYLHCYIGYDLLPLSFREVVANLRTAGFLHFVPDSIAQLEWSLTPQAMYWLSPVSFSFIHAFLPILISLVVFALWFICLLALKKWCLPRQIPDQNRSSFHRVTDGIVCRVINFVDSIWRYQFMSILFICLLQFMASEQGSQPGSLAMAIIVVLIGVLWTVGSQIYIRNQYYENEYSEFIYQFEDRYFCKIPLHSLPSRHHRLGYPMVKLAKAVLFVLVATICRLHFLTLSLLIFINGFEFWYMVSHSIYSDKRMLKLRIVENMCMLALQVLLLGVLLTQFSMDSTMYLTWGFILSTLALVTIGVSVVRVVFILYVKYVQAKGISFQQVDIDQKKLQTERAV